jgi:FkbM family methyltransferase
MSSIRDVKFETARLAYMQAKQEDLYNELFSTRDFLEKQISTSSANLIGDVSNRISHQSQLFERELNTLNNNTVKSIIDAERNLRDTINAVPKDQILPAIENLNTNVKSYFLSEGERLLAQIEILNNDIKSNKEQLERIFENIYSDIDSNKCKLESTIEIFREEIRNYNDVCIEKLVQAISDYKNWSEKISHYAGHSEALIGKALEGQMDAAQKLSTVESLIRLQPRYISDGVHAIISLPGYGQLAVPTTEVGVFNDFCVYGTANIESGVRNVLVDALPEDGVAVDIGASVGLHSLVLGDKLRNKGKLFAIEANPALWDALEQMFVMNGLVETAVLIRAAAADISGETEFFIAPHSPLSSLYPLSDSARGTSVTVPSVAIDEYFTGTQKIDVIKIDAEGAEPKIWRGMSRIIKENKDIKIVLEFASSHFLRANESPQLFLNQIVKDGFKLRKITEPNGDVVSVTEQEIIESETSNLFLSRI